ncbi:unnamed protein product [Linum trigynum]|uniref:Uncharacterized protein n=1 Tax=Linum trigynum TaxID=586398 RepID=A0AAV2GAU5_9ROSI
MEIDGSSEGIDGSSDGDHGMSSGIAHDGRSGGDFRSGSGEDLGTSSGGDLGSGSDGDLDVSSDRHRVPQPRGRHSPCLEWLYLRLMRSFPNLLAFLFSRMVVGDGGHQLVPEVAPVRVWVGIYDDHDLVLLYSQAGCLSSS